MSRALVLTYHAIEPETSSPLCVTPALFAAHLDALRDVGANVLTVRELAARLAERDVPDRAVAITFDDGFASVTDSAATLLLERGYVATIFCISGRIGGDSDWPTQPRSALRRPLASADALRAVVGAGFEVGSHGIDHSPLAGASEEVVRREVRESKAALEELLQAEVTSFAFPYGAAPAEARRPLLDTGYTAACSTSLAAVSGRSDPFALPRVDAHYVRAPLLLRGAVTGTLGAYLSARRVGAAARRTLSKDYAAAPTA